MVGLVAAGLQAQAQGARDKEQAFFTRTLSLDETQQARLKAIVNRKYDGYAQIAQYKETAPEKYAAKLQALFEGSLNSVRLLLKTPAQLEAFRQLRIRLRKQRAQLIKQYKRNNAVSQDVLSRYYSEVFFLG